MPRPSRPSRRGGPAPWLLGGAALVVAALTGWLLFGGETGPPHAEVDEEDRARLLEILREEDP